MLKLLRRHTSLPPRKSRFAIETKRIGEVVQPDTQRFHDHDQLRSG